MNKLIIFLIRKKLGLKKGQKFRFNNQKSAHNVYYFTEDRLMKHEFRGDHFENHESSVSLNWLLDDNCEIEKSHKH